MESSTVFALTVSVAMASCRAFRGYQNPLVRPSQNPYIYICVCVFIYLFIYLIISYINSSSELGAQIVEIFLVLFPKGAYELIVLEV